MKISKYTYMVDSEKNEVIFYNARIGYNSICKLNKSEFSEVFNNGKFAEVDTKVINFLQEKGHLVSDKVNEDIYMKELYLKTMKDDTLQIIILPTEKCNFKCIYCYEEFNNGKMSIQKVNQLIDFVQKKLKDKKSLRVEWFGGEPLIEIDLIEELSSKFMEICKKHRKLYFSSITTNGYLLDLEIFDRLYRARVLNYQITIDGTAEIHDKQRPLSDGRPTFDMIMRTLQKIRRERRARIKILLRTNCMIGASNAINDYLRYIAENFGEDKRFSILLRPVMDFGGTRIKEIKNQLIDLKRFGKLLEKNYEYIDADVYKTLLSPGGQICYAAKCNQYTIGSDGTIYKCTCDFENKDITMIGTLEDGIRKSDYCEWLLDMNQANEECKKCYYFPVCMGDSCPRKRIGCKEKFRCPIEYGMMDSILKILDKKGKIELHK